MQHVQQAEEPKEEEPVQREEEPDTVGDAEHAVSGMSHFTPNLQPPARLGVDFIQKIAVREARSPTQ